MIAPAMKGLLLARSFLIQGSWNYRDLIGSGLAWTLLPVTRRSSMDGSTESGSSGVSQEPFNAHPFLSTVAIGALAKLADEGADAEQTLRFRNALRSPLGSLGDKLVWGAWRPFCLLAAMTAMLYGAPPLWTVAGFLLVFNGLHLALRVWGLAIGLASGFGVARVLARARLAERAERIEVGGVLLSGFLLGGLSHWALAAPGWDALGFVAGAAALLAGVIGGRSLRRWVPGLLLILIALGFVLDGSPGVPTSDY